MPLRKCTFRQHPAGQVVVALLPEEVEGDLFYVCFGYHVLRCTYF